MNNKQQQWQQKKRTARYILLWIFQKRNKLAYEIISMSSLL